MKNTNIDYDAIEYVAFIKEDESRVNLPFDEREKQFKEWQKNLKQKNYETERKSK